MAKIRVYELAKELEVSSKELITVLFEEFGIEAKNHMSVIDDEDAELIKELYEEQKSNTSGIIEHYEEIVNENVNKQNKKNKKNKNRVREENDTKDENSLDEEVIEIGKTIVVKDLVEKLGKSQAEVIKQLMFAGVMANVNKK